ncbi:hypothetical protein ACF0H5_014069 [Mactra antiquata]
MDSFRLFKEILIVSLVIKVSLTFSMEPKYTKFQYDEQLLEKMIRLEIFVKEMEKETKKLISESGINETGSGIENDLTGLIDKQSTFEIELENLFDAHSIMRNDLDRLIRRMDALEQSGGGEGSVSVKDHTTVVFNAVSRTAQDRGGSSDPVVFESIIQNEGGGYDKSNGIFTAPVAGVYQYNAQLCANKEGNLEYAIDVGGANIISGEFRAASDSDDEKCISFSAAYLTAKGQEVSVEGHNCPLDAGNDDLLYFSGVLIKEV